MPRTGVQIVHLYWRLIPKPSADDPAGDEMDPPGRVHNDTPIGPIEAWHGMITWWVRVRRKQNLEVSLSKAPITLVAATKESIGYETLTITYLPTWKPRPGF